MLTVNRIDRICYTSGWKDDLVDEIPLNVIIYYFLILQCPHDEIAACLKHAGVLSCESEEDLLDRMGLGVDTSPDPLTLSPFLSRLGTRSWRGEGEALDKLTQAKGGYILTERDINMVTLHPGHCLCCNSVTAEFSWTGPAKENPKVVPSGMCLIKTPLWVPGYREMNRILLSPNCSISMGPRVTIGLFIPHRPKLRACVFGMLSVSTG